MLCCGYTLTDFPISIRLTSLALWQSNDCPSASKATLMNMDKYFMWIHYEWLHNHYKATHNKTVCIFLGIYCIWCIYVPLSGWGLITKPRQQSPISWRCLTHPGKLTPYGFIVHDQPGSGNGLSTDFHMSMTTEKYHNVVIMSVSIVKSAVRSVAIIRHMSPWAHLVNVDSR